MASSGKKIPSEQSLPAIANYLEKQGEKSGKVYHLLVDAIHLFGKHDTLISLTRDKLSPVILSDYFSEMKNQPTHEVDEKQQPDPDKEILGEYQHKLDRLNALKYKINSALDIIKKEIIPDTKYKDKIQIYLKAQEELEFFLKKIDDNIMMEIIHDGSKLKVDWITLISVKLNEAILYLENFPSLSDEKKHLENIIEKIKKSSSDKNDVIFSCYEQIKIIYRTISNNILQEKLPASLNEFLTLISEAIYNLMFYIESRNQSLHSIYKLAHRMGIRFVPLKQNHDPLTSSNRGHCAGYVLDWSKKVIANEKFYAKELSLDLQSAYMQLHESELFLQNYIFSMPSKVDLSNSTRIKIEGLFKSVLKQNCVYGICLNLSKSIGDHVVGVSYRKNCDGKISVELFDPNYGIFYFDDLDKFKDFFAFMVDVIYKSYATISCEIYEIGEISTTDHLIDSTDYTVTDEAKPVTTDFTKPLIKMILDFDPFVSENNSALNAVKTIHAVTTFCIVSMNYSTPLETQEINRELTSSHIKTTQTIMDAWEKLIGKKPSEIKLMKVPPQIAEWSLGALQAVVTGQLIEIIKLNKIDSATKSASASSIFHPPKKSLSEIPGLVELQTPGDILTYIAKQKADNLKLLFGQYAREVTACFKKRNIANPDDLYLLHDKFQTMLSRRIDPKVQIQPRNLSSGT